MNFNWIYDKGYVLCFFVVVCINACLFFSCYRIWMIVIRILSINCYNCFKVRLGLFIIGEGLRLMYDFSL